MNTTDLESRVARLEKSARGWKTAAGAVSLLALAALAMGQGVVIGGGTGGMKAPLITADNVVANQSVTVNDSNGNARIVLTTEKDIPAIQLKDKDGHTLLTLSVEKDAAGVLIQDAKGKKLYAAP